MKIDAKKLVSFVEKSTLNGKIETCIIRGDGQSLTTKSRGGNAIAVLTRLNNINEEIVLPIKTSKRLIAILRTFNGNVTLQKEGNLLKIFNESSEAEIVLADESFIDNEIKEDLPFTYGGNFQIDSKMLSDAIRNKAIVEAGNFDFEVKDKVFSISTGDKNFDRMNEKITVDYVDCKVNLGEVSIDVFQVLEGSVKLSMKTDYPIKVVMSNEEMSAIYHIAPIAEGD